MRERRRRFLVLAFGIILAQVVVNVPPWSGTGRTVSSHIYEAMISAFLAIVIIAVADRNIDAGESIYLQILFGSFIGSTAIAVIFDLVRFGGPGGALADLIARLVLTAAVYMVTAVYVSDIADFSWVLDVLSRRVFRQRLSPDFGVVGGNFNEADIRNAVPLAYPRREPGEPRPDSRRAPRRPPPDGPTDLARGNAWAEALLAENSGRRPRRLAPTPVITVVGFVQRRKDVKLAIINYFHPGPLLRALITMPRKIEFAGESFPVVARPWLTVQHGPAQPGPAQSGSARYGPIRHDGSGRKIKLDGHCWVTFGAEDERHGVVTATHVIVEQNFEIGSKVSTNTLRSEVEGIAQEEGEAREVVLIEMAKPRPEMANAPHSEVRGFTPICLCTGHGHKDGFITALNAFEGDAAHPKNPRLRPLQPTFMMFNVVGSVGDSGCLVLDTARGGAAPYLIYLRVTQQGHKQEGLGMFLGQVASQWKFNTHLGVRPPDDSVEDSSGLDW